MGIALGLLTAFTWGGADFLARFATHRIGTLRTMLYMQTTGFVLLTIFLPWLGGWGHLADGSGWQPWAWGLLAGCINAVSTLALYRSFEIGKMAVVAPLSASYPVLTIALSIFTGEMLRESSSPCSVCWSSRTASTRRAIVPRSPSSAPGQESDGQSAPRWGLVFYFGFSEFA